MKIVQLLPTLAYGDAIGNDAVAIDALLERMGCETGIYAENIDTRMQGARIHPYTDLPRLGKEDVVLYHLSTGSAVLYHLLVQMECRRFAIYHNITPAYFFAAYSSVLTKLVSKGRRDVAAMKDLFEGVIAVSEFNRRDLIESGYTCPIATVPVLIPWEEYRTPPDARILHRHKDKKETNILFVGRIAPNKCQEAILGSFACYLQQSQEPAHLFLIGNPSGMECYQDRLQRYADSLGIREHVTFAGHATFPELLAYYRLADIFLCMSEHEGFCVPLVEAMYFGIPIVAYAAAAIPETLGGGGILLPEKNPEIAAQAIRRIFADETLREKIRIGQKQQLEIFSYAAVASKMRKCLENIRSGNPVDAELEPRKESKNIVQETARTGNSECRLPDFEDIPINTSRRLLLRQYIKSGILKPAYHVLAGVAPGMAEHIRSSINQIWSGIRRHQHVSGPVGKPDENRMPTLLVDVTQTWYADVGTGIQRVVNQTVAQMRQQYQCLPILDQDGRLVTGECFYARLEGAAEKGKNLIRFIRGDKLLLLDSSWSYYRDFARFLRAARKAGVYTVAVIYDLVPIRYPEYTASPAFIDTFIKWHKLILQEADAIACISCATAADVAAWCREQNVQRRQTLPIYTFRMGVESWGGSAGARRSICNFVQGGRTFLMVGTVEPRKGHLVALAALRSLLRNGKNIRLLILGHNGWKNEDIRQEILSPSLAHNVLWIQDAADEELVWSYRHADALLAASYAEGYGLPLLEALQEGLPVIASDIPIFREVTKNAADFFPVGDSTALAACISAWLQTPHHPVAGSVRPATWRDAAEDLAGIFDKSRSPEMIYKPVDEKKDEI